MASKAKESGAAKAQPDAPAAPAQAVSDGAGTLFTPKIKRNLTLPVHRFVEETPSYFKILTKMALGKKMGGKSEAAKMEPATLVEIVNLETGENEQLICSKVIQSTLSESYPDDTYVGKGFKVVKHAKKQGKNYNNYSIAEIEV
jgi:hypothetical protein